MFETTGKLLKPLYHQAINTLASLVEKATEKAAMWSKKLMSEIAKKAVDWSSSAIKTGVDTLANQIKNALQPEQFITADGTVTEPTITTLTSGSVTSDPLANNLQPLVTAFTHQLVNQLAAYQGKQTEGSAPKLLPEKLLIPSLLANFTA